MVPPLKVSIPALLALAAQLVKADCDSCITAVALQCYESSDLENNIACLCNESNWPGLEACSSICSFDPVSLCLTSTDKDSVEARKVSQFRRFVPSLSRVCLSPGLTNCFLPLPPSDADQAKAEANSAPVMATENKREAQGGYVGRCGVPGMPCKVPVPGETTIVSGSTAAAQTPSVAELPVTVTPAAVAASISALELAVRQGGTVYRCGVPGMPCKDKSGNAIEISGTSIFAYTNTPTLAAGKRDAQGGTVYRCGVPGMPCKFEDASPTPANFDTTAFPLPTTLTTSVTPTGAVEGRTAGESATPPPTEMPAEENPELISPKQQNEDAIYSMAAVIHFWPAHIIGILAALVVLIAYN